MSEQDANKQTPNLIAQLAAKRIQINTSDVFKKFEEKQKSVNNSMNGLGMEDTQKLDKSMDI
ncbi:MAG: hypothetical protein IJ590_03075 [Rickettsiales bacterium]|nr:hypothetical protein [Rickettsiales bacterium]